MGRLDLALVLDIKQTNRFRMTHVGVDFCQYLLDAEPK